MKRTVRQIAVLLLAAGVAATALAARRGGRKPSADDAVREKIEEWIREVRKMEAAPVADGFVKWTGLDSVKGTKNARLFAPGDLRGRFTIIIDVDASKAAEQIKATMPLQALAFNPNGHTDWDFSPVKRDVVAVYNLHDLAEDRLQTHVFENESLKKELAMRACSFYGFVTFEGAPDCQGERPYVYVMPPEGTEPIYKGKVVKDKTVKEVKAAIAKASAALPAWRPYYGYVGEVKHVKGFDAAVAGGKSLAPFQTSLKKAIVNKNPEIAAEAQRLSDALEQRRGDLVFAILREYKASPCAALYDFEELSRRFPSMKRALSDYEDRIQKAHPGIASLYRHYALFRRCAAPDFRAKSASEAKKLAGELEKAKPVLKRMGDDPKDVAVQNMALSLLQRLDDLIGELPTKVQEK